MIKPHYITFEQTGQFSKLFLDYISGAKKLDSFYKYSPRIESFDQAIKDVSSQKFNRKLLVEVLEEQYQKAGITYQVSGIKSLLDENTFTVCTGHQLCLFTGPLYFIYKIITTINLAEELNKKYPENNFVPIFWMASEDHDFEEVNHINIFGKKIEWTNKQGGALGKYSNDGIVALIDELKKVFGDSKNANELIELFQNSYAKHADFSSATRFLVNELFGKYGLIILDGNDARLKREFVPEIEKELFENVSYKSVSKTIGELENLDYKLQVNPREINLFYLGQNQRNRIEYRNGLFNILDANKNFPLETLKEELKSHPERFSPNVVMRPLYQQKILPNLAYVGGPAEVAYWLQYKKMFDQFKIFFPVLMPRNFVMMFDASVNEKLKKFGLAPEDIFLPLHGLSEKYVRSISGEKISLVSEKESIMRLYEEISKKASLVDATLVASVEAEKQKHLKDIENLEKKLLRSFKQKNETAVGQIEKIKGKLFPTGALQERHDNFIPFYLKWGKEFIEELKMHLHPFDFRFNILSESD